MDRNSTIGITGATGFIGQALARRLTERCRPMRLFGRRQSTTSSGQLIEPLNSSPESLEGIDVLVHLAGIASSDRPESEIRRANIDLALDVARTAIAANVRRFIFFSSLHVHGKAAGSAITPQTPFEPQNSYARSKAEAERQLKDECAGRIELVIVRPPMIYGRGGKGSFQALLKLVKTGLPLPFGAATAKRSFCSISNLVLATEAVIDHPTPPAVFIPADAEDLSTRDLCLAMRTSLGSKSLLVPVPAWAMLPMLRATGRAEMGQSLFEPLIIDRTHWATWGWRPDQRTVDSIQSEIR
ncbi:NAD-dependent epimerase/dehydratase family protein [Kaistia sp. UC242_56]|uniref:NAD-dependent epimerase/dehydratase family protein n=1 Tax=Kaistia sp. UC242_56 TaxID=3374625 RepID=UPI0037BD4F2C